LTKLIFSTDPDISVDVWADLQVCPHFKLKDGKHEGAKPLRETILPPLLSKERQGGQASSRRFTLRWDMG
jgi:hypothetical protein